jgi:DNA-binding NtrC family response regulator/tetratricopeptide (TPR) repeat protein
LPPNASARPLVAARATRGLMADHPTDSIIGAAEAVAELRRQVRHLAAFDTPGNPHVPTVLVQGETGTGKGLVAGVIHASGGRAAGPFVDVNCAAIPETMLEAELFGFEAGAFTDARRAKPGLFEAAARGSLFLDEVDALPITLQSKLLKVIEEKRVRRLGAVSAQRLDVKLIAATQRDLRELVASGRFRADLYHRLALVILDVPPLRRRGADVVALAEHFLAEHAAAHQVPAKRLDDGARAWLLAYSWPGNVRELSHLMERVTLLFPDDEIGSATLEGLRAPLAGPATAPPEPEHEEGDADEATRIRATLARTGGNVVRAARLLGLGRNALRHRMRRLGVERPSLDEAPAARAPGRPTRVQRAAGGRPAGPADEPVREPSGEPRWEQKPVAVLAIDLVVPEDALEPWTVAQRWETMIVERLAGFEGSMVARSPSRLTAVFGVPRALEQLPQRAVLAALSVRRLAVTDGPELRMAVHAGTVRVDVAARDAAAGLLPLGDTLALPDRLLGHAGPGDILVSAAVGRRIASWCELRPRELRLGESGTLRAHAVVGRRPAATAETPAAALQTKFVGRQRELDLLRETFDDAVAGHGHVVFVVGEAGLGKSRLLAELRAGLAGDSHCWVEGRCASYGTTTAFLPIVDALRRAWDLDDQDDEARARVKVDRAIGDLGDEVAWTLPFVRHVLGLAVDDATVAALDSATRRSEIFRALKALVLQVARRKPLVLVVEDLHWIDPASEECLVFLADAMPTTRGVLICSYRPGHPHRFGDRSFHVRVTLRPLTAAEMGDISGALLGTADVPDEVGALIAAKAEGNPFFVEEVTRSLLEDGTLRRDNGRVVLAREADAIAVPDSIQDVLAARLDRLADDARRAIQVASVIGREFALRLLERITEAGEHVRTHVEELRALELIYEKAAHPELAYMFKHALTHDVAYESVLQDRRRALHRTIGLAIEELYADRLAEFYETLAHHFGRAEEWERALDYHERAAAKAAENFANRAVVVHCRQALAIADRLGSVIGNERRRALEEQLALACFYVNDFELSGEAYARAAACSGDPGTGALYLGLSGFSLFWGNQYARADEAVQRAFELARRHGATAAEALAVCNVGFFRGVCEGDVDAEAAAMEQAAALASRAGNEAVQALIGFVMAQMAEWRGDYRRSVALSEQVIAAGRRLRLAHLVIWPSWFLGKALCCLGQYGPAIARLSEAAEVCERIGDRVWKSRLLNTLGWCFAEIGSPARAREHNALAAVLAHEVGDPEIVGNSEINLAGDHLALGDLDGARGHLEPIVQRLARPGDPWMRWRYSLHATHVQGRLALQVGEPANALTHARLEIEGARRHRAPKIEARGLVLAGEALLAMDERESAGDTLGKAVEIADSIGYPHAARAALRPLAELARRLGRPAEAAQRDARRAVLLEAALGTLAEDELRRDLAAAAAH